jgi:multicomponent Na+:H+ antiporter subunit E
MRKVIMFWFLLAAWLLWSGMFEFPILAFGVISASLALILAIRMGCFAQEVFVLHVIPYLPRYVLYLLKDLVMSSLHVSKIVLSPRMRISPRLIRMDVSKLDTVGIAILGNSITVTPNTATVNCDGRELEVHCLTRFAAVDLIRGGLQERVSDLMAACGRPTSQTPADG